MVLCSIYWEQLMAMKADMFRSHSIVNLLVIFFIILKYETSLMQLSQRIEMNWTELCVNCPPA